MNEEKTINNMFYNLGGKTNYKTEDTKEKGFGLSKQKSIFLLCEHGISYNTVIRLYRNNITFNEIAENPKNVF